MKRRRRRRRRRTPTTRSAKRRVKLANIADALYNHVAVITAAPSSAQWQEGRHFAMYLFVHTKHTQKFARLKMDLPFHNRLAFT